MKDYSQTGEQALILKAADLGIDLPSPENRRFLDLGAYHPTVFSNTRALYELGWGGVMVEAAPGPMRTLIEEYGKEPRITLIQAAVSLAPGLIEMHISDDAVSTSDPASYETWKAAGGFVGKILVPAITLSEIFSRFGGYDFINIDVEGGSADLLLECLKMKVFPRAFCVEFDKRLPEIMTKASEAGYTGKVVGANVVLWQ